VQSGDTLDTVRDNLVALINNGDPVVSAHAAGVYDRIVLQARVEGPAGNDILIGASASSGATEAMTAFSSSLCCANVAGAPVTDQNPAAPGEIIYVYATGLGLPQLNDTISSLLQTGAAWPKNGPETAPPGDQDHSVSALAGGSAADVLSASILPGSVGLYKVVLHLNSSLTPNSATPVTIAQSTYVSNIAYIPITNQGTNASSSSPSNLPLPQVRGARASHLIQQTQPAAGSKSVAPRPQVRDGRVLNR
jgi:hypothetical protein